MRYSPSYSVDNISKLLFGRSFLCTHELVTFQLQYSLLLQNSNQLLFFTLFRDFWHHADKNLHAMSKIFLLTNYAMKQFPPFIQYGQIKKPSLPIAIAELIHRSTPIVVFRPHYYFVTALLLPHRVGRFVESVPCISFLFRRTVVVAISIAFSRRCFNL